jgi:hypothetical protein
MLLSLFSVILGPSLSGYALVNYSRRAGNDFYVKCCSTINTRSARKFSMFALTQLLRNWREQRPSSKATESSGTDVTGKVCYTEVDLLLTSLLYSSTWLLLGYVLHGKPSIMCYTFLALQSHLYLTSCKYFPKCIVSLCVLFAQFIILLPVLRYRLYTTQSFFAYKLHSQCFGF